MTTIVDLIHERVRVSNLCEGTDLKPWECMRFKGYMCLYDPNFCNVQEQDYKYFEFAIALLPDESGLPKPVFVGDVIYRDKYWETSYAVTENGLSPSTVIGVIPFEGIDWDKFSWTKPAPKRTFNLHGEELPCPDSSLNMNNACGLTIGNYKFYFKEYAEKCLVEDSLLKLLTEARDKDNHAK